jgi:hypothetical protein
MNLAGYDRFEHLRRALVWEPDTPIMIAVAKPYTMHADDSGKKSDSMIVVGGYLAEAAQWELLQKEWIPKVKNKRLEEFKRSAYDFKKWGDDFLLELADVIDHHAICSFACGVDCDAWRTVAKTYAMELYYLVPFSLCARTCISIVRDWCRTNNVPQDYMAYIFDKGSQDTGMLLELLNNDMSDEVRDITIIPEDSKRIVGLQCSDFFSWETRNQFLKNPNPTSLDELSPALAALLKGRFLTRTADSRVARFGVYNERNIEDVCKAAQLPLIGEVPDEIWQKPKPIRLKLPMTLGGPKRE